MNHLQEESLFVPFMNLEKAYDRGRSKWYVGKAVDIRRERERELRKSREKREGIVHGVCVCVCV